MSATDIRVLALLAATIGACQEPSANDPPGDLNVGVTTSGGDLDEDGYLVVVDDTLAQTITVTGNRTFDHLPVGSHRVELKGVAANCDPPRGRLVEITTGTTARLSFEVTCRATGLQLAVKPTGLDYEGPYPITVNDRPAVSVQPGRPEVITRLEPGTYRVELGFVPANCRNTGPNIQDVTVSVGVVTEVGFDLICGAAFGIVRVIAVTTGTDTDQTGYLVQVGSATAAGPTNGTVAVKAPGGDHLVVLNGVQPNCQVAAPRSHSVRIRVGGPVRDSVTVAFEASCTRFWEFAFLRNGRVHLASADGAAVEPLVRAAFSQVEPAWAPDGGALALACGPICITRFDGNPPVIFGNVPSDESVDGLAWSRSDSSIAFTTWQCSDYYCYQSTFGLFVIGRDGSGRTAIRVANLVSARNLSWAPDGRRLAMECTTATFTGICLLHFDPIRLETLPILRGEGRSPAWSPDGSRIAITFLDNNTSELALINPDGTGFVGLGLVGYEPSWSSDGRRLVFASPGGLVVANADGTGRTPIPGTGPADRDVAWRPRP